MADLELLDFQKVISRKIWVIEKSCNFHIVPTHSMWLENQCYKLSLLNLTIGKVGYTDENQSKWDSY